MQHSISRLLLDRQLSKQVHCWACPWSHPCTHLQLC